ncbi:hypothetical protein [Cupriavidus sp. TMH.W2]|uniref:hypothetical protein n=1 Tax=Cupriavidus sp. TMH.W2 TaxID=3434465 RepID=UPI003D7737DC
MTRAPAHGGPILPVAKRFSEPAHATMLMAAQQDLPRLAHTHFHQVDALNTALREQREALTGAVQQAIEEIPILDAAERKIWQAVPDVRYTTAPPTDPALVWFGHALARDRETKGKQRSRAEVLEICDVCLDAEVMVWEGLEFHAVARAGRKPLREPARALWVKWGNLRLYLCGNVYPTGCALGEVAQQLAQVEHALEAMGGAHEQRGSVVWQALFITDDARLFAALAPQAWGLLYRGSELLQHNLPELPDFLNDPEDVLVELAAPYIS